MSSNFIQTGLKPKTGIQAKVSTVANIPNALATTTVGALAVVGANLWAAITNPYETFSVLGLPINWYLFQAFQGLIMVALLAGIYYFVVKPASLGIKETEEKLLWTSYGKSVRKTVSALDKSELKKSTEMDHPGAAEYTSCDGSRYYVDNEANAQSYEERKAYLESLEEKPSVD